MNDGSKIPIFVLTGFLGSGKTALINGLLKQPAFSDSAVVVNEFGEIGLDHLLVSSSQENIVLLDAGCLCCAVLGSLKETLADLYQRRIQGDAPPFRRVLVETTGLADPGPILQSIMRDTLISSFYRLAGLVCVVDAMFGVEELAAHAEARAQVACADILLLTKTDLTGNTCPDALRRALNALNPTAEIKIACHGNIDAATVIGEDGRADRTPWLGTLCVRHDDHDPQTVRADLHDSAITAESFWIEEPATWSGLAAWIETLRRRCGSDLLRCKGIINMAPLGRPVLIHGVQTMFDTIRLPEWPDAERRSRLVVIGRGLDREMLKSSIAWLHAPEGTQPPLDPMAAPPVWEAA